MTLSVWSGVWSGRWMIDGFEMTVWTCRYWAGDGVGVPGGNAAPRR